jgi:hypothetical protein
VGGELTGQPVDFSALGDVRVTLRIDFPGTIRRKGIDKAADLAHSGRAVTYRLSGADWLSRTTPVEVHIVPDIEGTPYFWLALIVAITVLAVAGAIVVLRQGRAALKSRQGS